MCTAFSIHVLEKYQILEDSSIPRSRREAVCNVIHLGGEVGDPTPITKLLLIVCKRSVEDWFRSFLQRQHVTLIFEGCTVRSAKTVLSRYVEIENGQIRTTINY